MKVLLTGATGFLGSEIARELVRQGHAVRVLVRKTSKLDGLAGLEPLERVEGDICDRASVERALDGADALIHTAGNTRHALRETGAIRRVNVDGVRVVMQAALDRGRGLRVVHTSSIAAVGARAEPVLLDEETAWDLDRLGEPYITSKYDGERIVLDFARRGLDVAILNPGIIYGPGDVSFSSTRYVLEYVRGANRFWSGGGISSGDVRDIARAHVAALARGRAGERYILAGQNFTFRETQEALARLTGLGRPRRLPYAAGWAIALALETAGRFFPHRLDDVTRPVFRMGYLYQFMDCSKAQRELGYVVRPFDETLRDTLRDHLARGAIAATTPELEAIAREGPPAAAPAGAAALASA